MTELTDKLEALAQAATPGNWSISGVRVRIGREVAHSIIHYDQTKPKDEQIACVWYDPKTHLGWADASLIVELRNNLPAIIAALRKAEPDAGEAP